MRATRASGPLHWEGGRYQPHAAGEGRQGSRGVGAAGEGARWERGLAGKGEGRKDVISCMLQVMGCRAAEVGKGEGLETGGDGGGKGEMEGLKRGEEGECYQPHAAG